MDGVSTLPPMTAMLLRKAPLLAAASLLLLPGIGSAQESTPDFSRYSQVSVRVSNQTYPLEGGALIFPVEDSSDLFTDGQLHEYGSFLSFTGLDSSFNEQTMNFSGRGTVQSDFKTLKTRYQGTLENSFFNEENIPRFNSQTGEYDPSGVPDVMDGVAIAGWTDKLQYGGTATGYYSTYVFRITGSNANSKSFSLLDISVGSGGNQRFTLFDQGVTDKIIRTTPVFIGTDGLKAEVQLSSFFQPNMKELADGATFSGDSNFANTIEFVGVELRDMDGNLVTDVPLFGASGTVYQPVPEPGTLAIAGGLLALGLTRLRGRKKAA
jgi:hypothetical protein